MSSSVHCIEDQSMFALQVTCGDYRKYTSQTDSPGNFFFERSHSAQQGTDGFSHFIDAATSFSCLLPACAPA